MTTAAQIHHPATDDAPAKRSWPRRIARRGTQAVAVFLVLALVGALVQAVAERRDAAAHPAPGELVELPDGRRLHLQIAGEQHEGPTVVLEGGAGASSPAWAWVQPAVAEHATVVAYDRAGLGWSDPSTNQPDADAVITDLRNALAARGLPGPYVLVGHSLGAHYARAFAQEHPDQVAGLVLVDPSHERMSEVVGPHDGMAPLLAVGRAATRIGLTRIYNPFEDDVPLLPQPQRDQALAQMVTVGHVRTFGAEMMAVDRVGALLDSDAGTLGDRPLRVVNAAGGATSDDQQAIFDALVELREGLTDLSNMGESTVLPDASHTSIITDQVHAAVVSDAVIDVVTAASR